MNLHIIALFKFNENYLMEAVELFQNLVKKQGKKKAACNMTLLKIKITKEHSS
jgi:hypothetical protein